MTAAFFRCADTNSGRSLGEFEILIVELSNSPIYPLVLDTEGIWGRMSISSLDRPSIDTQSILD